MRSFIFIASAILLATAAWFFTWRSLMADDVAQVRASIDHHYQAIKAQNATTTLKADEVYATGFPFGFRVAVARPTLTQVWGRDTYAISLDRVELENVNTAEGRYRVTLPAKFDAMYATSGQAPERYRITLNEVLAVLLRAQADSQRCPNFPGSRPCAATAPTDPLISFAAQLPARLVLDATLNGNTKQIGFNLTPIAVPIFITIPADADQPLQRFVGMLREALVYSTN